MPQTYVTGSCLIFVGIGGVQALTTVRRPENPPTFRSGPRPVSTTPDPDPTNPPAEPAPFVGPPAPPPDPLPVLAADPPNQNERRWPAPPHPTVELETTLLSAKRPVLLGTAEYGPSVHLKPRFRHMRTSESGEAADDLMFTGEEAAIIVNLNWWDERVLAVIQSRPWWNRVRGFSFDDSIGTLMSREGQTFPVWLVFPYYSKINSNPTAFQVGAAINQQAVNAVIAGLPVGAAFAAGAANVGRALAVMKDMPAGYLFYECVLGGGGGADVLDPLGSRARKVSLAFHAIRERQRTRGVKRLYSHDMSAISGYSLQAQG